MVLTRVSFSPGTDSSVERIPGRYNSLTTCVYYGYRKVGLNPVEKTEIPRSPYPTPETTPT